MYEGLYGNNKIQTKDHFTGDSVVGRIKKIGGGLVRERTEHSVKFELGCWSRFVAIILVTLLSLKGNGPDDARRFPMPSLSYIRRH